MCFLLTIFFVDARIKLDDDRCGVPACLKFFLSIYVYGFQCVLGVLKATLVRWLLSHGLSWMSTDCLAPNQPC